MVEQGINVTFRLCQIASPKRNRTRRLGQGVTQRCQVIGRASVLDAALARAHRLIRKALQPQDPRKDHARRLPQTELKANDAPIIGSDVTSEDAFEMAASAG
jgi:hypothetical protein